MFGSEKFVLLFNTPVTQASSISDCCSSGGWVCMNEEFRAIPNLGVQARQNHRSECRSEDDPTSSWVQWSNCRVCQLDQTSTSSLLQQSALLSSTAHRCDSFVWLASPSSQVWLVPLCDQGRNILHVLYFSFYFPPSCYKTCKNDTGEAQNTRTWKMSICSLW